MQALGIQGKALARIKNSFAEKLTKRFISNSKIL